MSQKVSGWRGGIHSASDKRDRGTAGVPQGATVRRAVYGWGAVQEDGIPDLGGEAGECHEGSRVQEEKILSGSGAGFLCDTFIRYF